MGFAIPAALLALFAVGLPVALHLLRRRDLPTFTLPTLTLLAHAKAESRRRVRMRDVALLLARVLMVALAALALAAPFRWTPAAFAGTGAVSLALVVDDSMSMMRAEGGERLLETARARALALVDALPPGSEAAVIGAGTPARLLVPRTTDLAAARRALRALPPASARATDGRGAMALASRALRGARAANPVLWVLTDGSAHGQWTAAPTPDDAGVTVERLGADSRGRAIVGLVLAADPLRTGHGSVRVEVIGTAPTDTLELDVDGAHVWRGKLGDASTRGVLEASVALPRGGRILTAALAPRDSLAMDDQRSVPITAAGGPRVLLVTADADRTAARSSARFLEHALAAAAEGGTAQVRVADPARVDGGALDSLDLVVLLGLPAVSPGLAARLEAFVHGGGVLVVAAGGSFAPEGHAAPLPAPVAWGEVVTESPPMGLRADPASGIPAEGWDGAVARRRVLLDDWAPDATVLVRYADGAPACLAAARGRGQVLVLTTSLDDSWSNLPFRVGFLGLTRAILARAGAAAPQWTVRAGAVHRVTAPPDAIGAVVISPDGSRAPLAADRSVNTSEQPGAHEVRFEAPSAAGTSSAWFVVEPDPAESDLRHGPLPAERDVGAEGASRERVQSPLAHYAFLAVGLFALAEALLRGSLRLRHAHRAAN